MEVVNFKKRKIGKLMQEVMKIGMKEEEGEVVIEEIEKKVKNGGKIFQREFRYE